MAATGGLIQEIGKAVKAVAKGKGSKWWYTPHMAAASRAIAERIPLVDLVLEVRDARFLTFLQARVRELKKKDDPAHAITLMLVGIPNVGKSALANSLHQVGRIAAAEKGKLKHSVVSPQPGETKGISSLKVIASHPNIYVLDTPGVLPPDVVDDGVCSKLALTGAIKDDVVGEIELAQYFLSILSLSDEYKKWGKLSGVGNGGVLTNERISSLDKRPKRQYPTDHTQDFIVNNVRRSLLMRFHLLRLY
ncbi:hypothetical protein DH2020_023415 [Rehmannia glutinosa]|uniref:G domain-containing protein n=1 Tax=Rehmannia glutinosa TaxID=99300 RepID=A0ABR0W9Y8_REHGL